MPRTWTCMILLVIAVTFLAARSKTEIRTNLRRLYSLPSDQWPRPNTDPGVNWTEIGPLPSRPVPDETMNARIELGKALFFDTRLSGSGKISCASCHQPSLSWTDGKERSIGHEGAINKRNSPTIQNTWFYTSLFWDGRARDLEDQAFAPINSESEMHQEMPALMRSIRNVEGYREMFLKAYGDEMINPETLTGALAAFERSIVSAESRFDRFMKGDRKALSNSELRGLHIFRTKAGCMNCHNGPLFTDNAFHRNGQVVDPGFENDQGRYKVTHLDEDLGKFRTPSLRDVMFTGPWMHDGSKSEISGILNTYNKGGEGAASPHIRPLNLDKKELKDLEAFLKAISSPPVPFTPPVLPG